MTIKWGYWQKGLGKGFDPKAGHVPSWWSVIRPRFSAIQLLSSWHWSFVPRAKASKANPGRLLQPVQSCLERVRFRITGEWVWSMLSTPYIFRGTSIAKTAFKHPSKMSFKGLLSNLRNMRCFPIDCSAKLRYAYWHSVFAGQRLPRQALAGRCIYFRVSFSIFSLLLNVSRYGFKCLQLLLTNLKKNKPAPCTALGF